MFTMVLKKDFAPPDFIANDTISVDMRAPIGPGDWVVVPYVRRNGGIEIKTITRQHDAKAMWRIMHRSRNF